MKKISETRRPNAQGSGTVNRLIESLASIGHSYIWTLMCAISVCNTMTVCDHLSSTPSISGPGSATGIPASVLSFTYTNTPSRTVQTHLTTFSITLFQLTPSALGIPEYPSDVPLGG